MYSGRRHSWPPFSLRQAVSQRKKKGAHPKSGLSAVVRPPYARISGCNAQFFQQRKCPGLLQSQARRQGRSACFGVKCHKACERNLLNDKKDVSNAPRDANYLQDSPCNIRTVILDSDSKGQWFESTRAHQPIEIPSAACLSAPNLAHESCTNLDNLI